MKRLAKDNAWLAAAAGGAVKVVSQLLESLPATNAYKVIFMRRDLSEVLKSQQAMLDRRGEKGAGVPPDQLAKAFEQHLAKVDAWLKQQKNIEVLLVPYKSVVADPRAQAARVAEFLGMKLDLDAMAAVVSPSLYRNRG